MARVAVFFGGRSDEHEVSCVSAVSAIEALEATGHHVIPVGIDRQGGLHLAEGTHRPLRAEGPAIDLVVPGGDLVGGDVRLTFDVAFPVLHGPFGEDGTIQGLFEMAGVPYVGAGVLGSAAAMDKDVAKRLFRDAGLPITPFFSVRRNEFEDDPSGVVDEAGTRVGYPAFVKPAALGSSVGISRASGPAEMKGALADAFAFGAKAIVETESTGREIEVAVLEGPRASLPGEIIVHSGWYTYDAKYRDDATELVIPAPLPESATATVRRMAAEAFEVLDGAGLARVDFFYEEGERGFLLNEVNTMPGFTPKSMFPMMWAASGLPYDDLCDELVALALARRS
jgi:D-alanine-D-alanine ligase